MAGRVPILNLRTFVIERHHQQRDNQQYKDQPCTRQWPAYLSDKQTSEQEEGRQNRHQITARKELDRALRDDIAHHNWHHHPTQEAPPKRYSSADRIIGFSLA